jgi:hypothetical protein
MAVLHNIRDNKVLGREFKKGLNRDGKKHGNKHGNRVHWPCFAD